MRVSRGILYARVSRDIERRIAAGMFRPQVEAILRGQGISYIARSGATRAYDILIPLGREASPVWYCSFIEAQTLVRFTPSPERRAHVGSESAEQPTDIVTGTEFEHQLGDCL